MAEWWQRRFIQKSLRMRQDLQNDFDRQTAKSYPEPDSRNLGCEPIQNSEFTLENTDVVVAHKDILILLIKHISKVDFRKEVQLVDDEQKLAKKHYLVSVIQNVLDTSLQNNWGLCRNNNLIYLYNGHYWSLLQSDELQTFLGEAAEKMGIDKYDARVYHFREQLYKQFIAAAHLPKPERSRVKVLINLKNGTFEIGADRRFLRAASRQDFLTYQLPFEYDPNAKAPKFGSFLNRVLPDVESQTVLAEYLGYVFISPSLLKLEKALLLLGSGANGKSVFFEIVYALLGSDNVSNYSLDSLTKHDGYQRAQLGNKLINYGSEINGKLETSIFKLLVSGEPVEARHIYGDPFVLTDYAKMIFNCNELPRDVEQSHAFFRRFLIIPFSVTIPDDEQDKELAKKIIRDELSGVFNWVLEHLNRLLVQKSFSNCDAATAQLTKYRKESDSVSMFLEDERFLSSVELTLPLAELYTFYKQYCFNYGYHSCAMRSFGDRLRNNGIRLLRKAAGNVVYVSKVLNS